MTIKDFVVAFQEGLRLITQVFPMPAIVASVAFVAGAIWYSLRGRK